MENILLTNCKVYDGKELLDGEKHILIEDGKIAKIAAEKLSVSENLKIYNLKGLIVCPGFIDLHAHLRDPGVERGHFIRS